jgi:plastocyanin
VAFAGRWRRVARLAAGWAALAVPAAALVGASGAGPRRHQLRIVKYEYQPDTMTVALGDTIVWENRDIVTHTITGDAAPWDSGDVDPNKGFTLVATERGRAAYHCEIHPAMKAVLIVR